MATIEQPVQPAFRAGDKPLHASVNLTAYAVLLIGIAAFGSVFLRF